MGLRTLGRWSALVALGLLAWAPAACSSAENAAESGERANKAGTLSLPLTITTALGTVYRLRHANFLVRDDQGTPVITLSSDDDLDAPTVTTELEAGSYTVELLDGWSLRRVVDGEEQEVVATLSSPAVLAVTLSEEQESNVLYEFVVGPDGSSGAGGSLVVGIAVTEGEACGNGVLDEGEECDDGADSGTPDHCDASCAFVCLGPCPLRVDPGASSAGDGRTWESAFISVSAAIEQQYALGGGEVWVRGPGPYPTLAGDPLASLIRLREGVSLLGGFAGTELQRSDRDPDAQTLIQGANYGVGDDDSIPVPPLIVGESSTWLEGFGVSDHDGGVLFYDDAEGFRVVSFTVADSSFLRGKQIEVTNSSGRFDRLRVRDSGTLDGWTGAFLQDSHVTFADSEFTRLSALFESSGIDAVSSELYLESVVFSDNTTGGLGQTSGLELTDSVALAVDSVWLGGRGFVSALSSSDSRFIAVSSHWEDNFGDAPPVSLRGGEASFVNSSFVASGSSFNSAVSGSNGIALDIVNGTFFDNQNAGLNPEDASVGTDSTLTIYNTFADSGASSFSPFSGSGNCIVAEGSPVDIRTDPGYSEVYLTPALGCADIGDDAAADAALLEAQDLANELNVFFPVPLNLWDTTTSTLASCPDVSPIDPGRHYLAPSCTGP